MQLLYSLYNLAAVFVVIIIIPVFLVRSVREKGFVERIRQSLGFFPKGALQPVAKKNCIWVHAASVGEIVATSPLIKEFRREFPKSPILVSVVTTSGYEMAKRIIKDADSIIYFPLDLPFVSAHVFKKIFPRVFLNRRAVHHVDDAALSFWLKKNSRQQAERCARVSDKIYRAVATNSRTARAVD